MNDNNGIVAYLKGDGLQKVIAVGCLVVLYIFFGIFGNHFLTFNTIILHRLPSNRNDIHRNHRRNRFVLRYCHGRKCTHRRRGL